MEGSETGEALYRPKRQIRYLASEVIRLQPLDQELLPNLPETMLGELLVKAGELLFTPHPKPSDPWDAMANFISQFYPAYEIDAQADGVMLLMRFYVFLTRIIPNLPSELKTFEIGPLFESLFGVNLKTYCEGFSFPGASAEPQRETIHRSCA